MSNFILPIEVFGRLLRERGWSWVWAQQAENFEIMLGRYDGAFIGMNGGGLSAIAAGALPVIGQMGVFVALGAPYAQARELVEDDETASGMAQGFVMGLLNWQWSHAKNLFLRRGVIRVYQGDEALNSIRVRAYNSGMKAGFLLGSVFPAALQSAFVKGLRRIAGHPSSGNWSRNDQVSFVISLASALRRYLRKQ